MKIFGLNHYLMMSKKDNIALKLREKGYSGVKIKWVPHNVHGKNTLHRGWLFKPDEKTDWINLGKSYEEAIQKIELL